MVSNTLPLKRLLLRFCDSGWGLIMMWCSTVWNDDNMTYCIVLFIGKWASMIYGVTIVIITICDELVGGCWETLVFTCKNVRKFSEVVRVYVLWMEGFYSGHREGEGGGCGTFCHPTLSIHMVTVSWFHSDCGGAIVWGCVRMRGWIIPSVEGHLQSLDVTMRHTMDPHEHGLCD